LSAGRQPLSSFSGGSSRDAWILAIVVPERELERFGEAGVLDLLELAAEIQELVTNDRAA